MKIKKRHIHKAIACFRTGNLKHLLGKKKLIQFIPTLKCPLDCIMCHQFDIRRKCEPDMSIEQIEKMLENLKASGVTQINLCGGEFFIDKERAFKIIDLLEQNYFLYSIATNAVLLNEEDILSLSYGWGLCEFDTSIDGFKETHDNIRQVPGSFDRTIQNIKIIKKINIPIMVVTVIQRDNIEELPELVKFVHSLGVDSMTLCTEFSISPKDFDSSQKILENISGKPVQIFGSTSIDSTTFRYPYELFKNKVNDAKRIAAELNFELNTSFEIERDDSNIFEYIYDKTVRQTHHCSCSELGSDQIDWMGNKNICPFIRIEGLNCGKAYEQEHKGDDIKGENIPNKKYFDDPETAKIVEKIKAQNLLPMCTRCCSLKVVGHKANVEPVSFENEIICLYPMPAYAEKQWNIEDFVWLATEISKKAKIWVILGPEEYELAPKFVLNENMEIVLSQNSDDLKNILKYAKLYIGAPIKELNEFDIRIINPYYLSKEDCLSKFDKKN